MGYGPRRGLPPQPGTRQLGYSEDERNEWLAQCRRRYSDKPEDKGWDRDECEDYLARYEAGYGAGYYGGGHGYYGHGYGYGFPPAPVMWVPVMIPGCCKGCKKEKIVEEWIEEEAPHVKVPTKLVPVKTKTVKSVK
jgi:hypothetical protein